MPDKDPGKFQAILGAVYILAFLAAVSFCFQPYDSKLLRRYVVVAVVLEITILLSRFKLAMLAGGFAVLAFRCIIGSLLFKEHYATLLIMGAASASIAWALFKKSIKRYG